MTVAVSAADAASVGCGGGGAGMSSRALGVDAVTFAVALAAAVGTGRFAAGSVAIARNATPPPIATMNAAAPAHGTHAGKGCLPRFTMSVLASRCLLGGLVTEGGGGEGASTPRFS